MLHNKDAKSKGEPRLFSSRMSGEFTKHGTR
jgi:hypothetical protein